ncbi:hypothetical protein LTS18_005257 [Coniosporium uncinatum]|nr:hypothetical protein LTS18_005257 [Coniosporium uncinatum]
METLAAHPNIVGCKLSHGAIDDHALIASSPNIDHANFATYTGLGQQLLPVLVVGGAGAIDGLASMFPKTVVRLYEMYKGAFEGGEVKASLEEMRKVQYTISRGEKLVARWGTIGIKEGVSRVLSMGDRDGGRMPLSGGIPGGDKEWENWRPAIEALQEMEKSL